MFSTLIQQISRALTWFFTVAPWEQAILVRLGKHTKVLGAGIYFRIPFVDRIFKQSVRRRINTIKAQTLTTRDGKVVTCSGAVGYRIGDLGKLYDTLESANMTIENEVSGIIAAYIGSRNLHECQSRQLEEFVAEKLDLSKYGLEGQEFYVQSFAASKTYRLITGEIGQSWQADASLCLTQEHTPSPAL
jgi:regulator of protease activity HflC (stomatin/prohibitin superfamily)